MPFNLLQRYVHSPKELIPGFRKMLPLSEIYSILPYFIYTPSLSYCLRLPVGGSVSVMRTTASPNRLQEMLHIGVSDIPFFFYRVSLVFG